MAAEFDLEIATPRQRQVIQAYRAGGFTIGGVQHAGPVLVLPERTEAWRVTVADQLGIESFEPLMQAAPEVEILIVGAGADFWMAPPDLRLALHARGVALESMTTPAACRTFNVLLAEDRRVAAALMPV